MNSQLVGDSLDESEQICRKFKGEHVKLGLKFRVCAYNFADSGSNVTKLFPRDVPRGRGVQVGTIFGEGPPLKFGRAKFGAISDNFRL